METYGKTVNSENSLVTFKTVRLAERSAWVARKALHHRYAQVLDCTM
jgi:hypothetical protein